MSNREIVKELVFKTFPNGYQNEHQSGYCHYIIKNNNGVYRIEHLTSGMFLNVQEITIPPKYYDTTEELWNDIKLYFDNRDSDSK